MIADRFFAVLQRLQVLPALPFWAWMLIFGVNVIVTLCNFVGARLLSLFAFSDAVANATIFFFVLLALTPLYFPPRVVFVVRQRDSIDWVEVSERDAMRCKADGSFIVRRMVVFKGQIVEQRDV